jgi:lipid-A-disaccharide synthase
MESLTRLSEDAGIFRPSDDRKGSRLVVIVAGEASADLHGSHLVKAIRSLEPGTVFVGIGGKQMEQAGVKILLSSSDMAVVGVTEVFSHLGTLYKAFRSLKSILREARPDLLILIDFPDFNLQLAARARRYRVPVLYYISPQVWAWRKGRVRKIAGRVDRMAVILPFEESFYSQRGVKVDYVGHPLLDSAPPRQDLDRLGGMPEGSPVVGLLPGSRKEEIRSLLPVMLRAVDILRDRYPQIRCRLSLAPTIAPGFLQRFIPASSEHVKIIRSDIYEALGPCHLAFVASGTATLETAIAGVPMIVVYRVSPLSFRIAKMMVKVPYISLVNLVAGEEIVRELVQDEVTPYGLAREAIAVIEDRIFRDKMIKNMEKVRERLGGGGASERTARIALEMINKKA